MTDLEKLARLHHIQTVHFDGTGRRAQPSTDALLLTLRALGVPAASAFDLRAALLARRRARWETLLQPVVVSWEGRPIETEIRLPLDRARGAVHVTLETEDAAVRRFALDLESLPERRTIALDGQSFVAKTLRLPGAVPSGYHRLTLEKESLLRESLVIASPLRAFSPPENDRAWGVFLPLYALYSRRSWGAGDYSDLEALIEWQASLGGRVVSTLPFLAQFLDEPCDPSPYGPASRIFWNELYLDVTRVPELEHSPEAQAALGSDRIKEEIQALRAAPLIDYRRLAALKRRVLEPLARYFFRHDSARRAELDAFVEARPALSDYAAFRAFGETRRSPWPDWPARERDGTLQTADVDPARRQYHLYSQWLAQAQVESASRKAREAGTALYLDLPLGAQLWSYDVWRERKIFALDVALGAPPDGFFVRGQDWGLPPMHPEAIRAGGHRYFRAAVKHQLEHAGLLRIDHVMGLHRLFWIPKGLEARDGVYVGYPADELYAILCLESHRHRSALVGENLGTVPSRVDRAMTAHGLKKMHVLQFDLRPDPEAALGPVPPDVVGSLGTHDTPTFEGFRRGLDVDDRVELGLLEPSEAPREHDYRRTLDRALGRYFGEPTETGALVRACLGYLAQSPAWLVLVNLEDLWGETAPQNVPGISSARPNWRRKARYALEELCQMPEVLETMNEIRDLRESSGGKRRG